jgi:hypothetical protein
VPTCCATSATRSMMTRQCSWSAASQPDPA